MGYMGGFANGGCVDSALVNLSGLRDQIDWLRREIERKDTIIMSMAQRIPELEPAPEPPYAPETATESTVKRRVSPEPQEPPQRRPGWWRRFFGFSSE